MVPCKCLPNLIRVLKKGCHLFATINSELYDIQRLEWAKQIKDEDCNCELIEDVEIPYRDAAEGVVAVIHKLHVDFPCIPVIVLL